MRKAVLGLVVVAVVAGGAWYYWSGGQDAAASATPAAGGTTGATGGGGRRGRGAAGTMTVDTALSARHEVIDYITVVGNLIGEATVDIVPRVAGRLDTVNVKLGDRVTKGQQVFKVEDRELREQVNQSEANLAVNKATVTARENDLKVAQNALDRAKTSFQRELISRQALEDADSRYNAAASQIDVAKAQQTSTQARLDELKITLSNTTILSPVDGFVAKRNLDPGGFAGGNTVVLSLVDLSTVRMIANLVEKDFKRVQSGAQAAVEVDAFPGEEFTGQVSRVAPVFDPATRTATMEIEVPNPGFRLKPGMYARVKLTADRRADAVTVPRNAVVDIEGNRGVFLIDADGATARFHQVHTGISDTERMEIVDGLDINTRIITVGSLGLRDGDRVIVAGAGGRGGRGRGQGAAAQGEAGQAPAPPGAPGAEGKGTAAPAAGGTPPAAAPAGPGAPAAGGAEDGQDGGRRGGGRGQRKGGTGTPPSGN